jgi:hypothetical protein
VSQADQFPPGWNGGGGGGGVGGCGSRGGNLNELPRSEAKRGNERKTDFVLSLFTTVKEMAVTGVHETRESTFTKCMKYIDAFQVELFLS